MQYFLNKKFFLFALLALPIFADPTEDLFNSVKKRNILGIDKALKEGADINAGNEWNTTPLMLATHYKALPIVKALLERKANPNAINYRNESALRIACQKNFTEIIDVLIDNGADVNEEFTDGSNLLMNYLDKQSEKEDEIPILNQLIERGANINHQKETGESVLMVRMNDPEIFSFLISKNADLNIRNKDGNTLLHIAIENKDIELVKLLLEKKANVNIQNFLGDSPLMQAIYFDQKEIISLILEKNPELNLKDREGMTALVHAIDKKQIEIVNALVTKGADINITDNKGYTPLMYALLSEEQIFIDLLVNSGADLFSKSQKGFTVFMIACYKGNIPLVNLLLEKNVNIEEPSNSYETALYNAIRSHKDRQYEVAQILLEKKTKNKKGKYKDYGVLSAAYYNDYKSMQYFIEQNFDINIRDKEGSTSLMIASERGYSELVNLLLTNKAKKKRRNKKRESALSLAVKNNHWNIVRILSPSYKLPAKTVSSPQKVVKTDTRVFKPTNQELLEAIQKDSVEKLSTLLNSGDFSINEQYGDKGKSPLMLAAYYGSFRSAKFLVENNADLSLKDSLGAEALLQPILFARLEPGNIIYPSHLFVLRLILGEGANVNTKDFAGDSFLYSATYYNLYEIVKIALEFKANVNDANEKGLTALHVAAWHKNEKIVKALLSHNANVHLKDRDDRTPLYMVCLSKENEFEIIRILLTKNSDLHIRSKSGNTPLELIKANGYDKILKIVLKSSAEVKTLEAIANYEYEALKKEFNGKMINWKNDSGHSLLELVSRYGKVEEVAELLEKGADANIFNSEMETPLMVACDRGNYQIAKLLVDHNAEINFQTKKGNTPLMSAAFQGKADIVQLLLDRGAIASMKNEVGDNALSIAARYGHSRIAQMLLDKRVHVNALNKYFGSPLMAAVKGDDVEISEKLLRKNANPHFKFSEGENALMMAVMRGNLKLVKILLANKAKINEENRDRKTALILAVENGHYEIVKVLLNENANIREKLINGSNLLHVSILKGYRNISELLLEFSKKHEREAKGINVNEKDINSLTPLMLASGLGDKEAVKLLLNYGADKSIADIQNYTAFTYAKDLNSKEIMKLLD